MSGGYFNYRNQSLADEIFGWNMSCRYGQYGFSQAAKARQKNPLQDKIISELTWDLLCVLYSYDYYMCADTGEDDYREDVEYFKKKWLKPMSKERMKEIIDEELGSVKKDLYQTFEVKDEADTAGEV